MIFVQLFFKIIVFSPALFIMPKPVADATTGGAAPQDAGWSDRKLQAPMAAYYIQRAGGGPRLAGLQEKKWPLMNRNIGAFILDHGWENHLPTILRHWYNKNDGPCQNRRFVLCSFAANRTLQGTRGFESCRNDFEETRYLKFEALNFSQLRASQGLITLAFGAKYLFCLVLLVDPTGIEPVSEKRSARVSPGAVCLQHFLCGRPANRPRHW